MLPAILGLGGLTAKIIATAVIPRVVRAISLSLRTTRTAEPCSLRSVEGISSAPKPAFAPTRSGASGSLKSSRKFGYAGLWHHAPSGLDLATYRAYDAANRRWISRDPLGEGVDYNLYRYCGNNPISRVDPSGLTPAAALTLVGGAAVAPEAIVTTALTAVAVSLAGAVEAQMQAEAAELALQATLAAQAAQMARKGAETAQRAKRTAEELSRAARVGWCTRRYNQEIKECQMKFPFDARERAVCYSQASERLAACIGRAWQCSNRYPPKYNP